MNLGLMGFGSVGRFILDAINVKQILPDVAVSAVCTRAGNPPLTKDLSVSRWFTGPDAFLDDAPDLVIEAATVEAAKRFIPTALARGRSVLLLSVGALVDPRFRDEIGELSDRFGAKVYVPSGAIGGLDALRAANALQGIDRVLLTTTKPPLSFGQQTSRPERKVVFDGVATDAIEHFPKNVNVAIALSLSGIGTDATEVRVINDPAETVNRHHIDVSGAFGHFSIDLHCMPLDNNPRTSALAALSVIAALRNLRSPVMFV